MLHCRALPSVGGNTLFTNMYLAYETLSEALRRILDRLHIVNDVSLAPEYKVMDPEQVAQSIRDNPPMKYPLVRVHPSTGRRALYVSDMLTRGPALPASPSAWVRMRAAAAAGTSSTLMRARCAYRRALSPTNGCRSSQLSSSARSMGAA